MLSSKKNCVVCNRIRHDGMNCCCAKEVYVALQNYANLTQAYEARIDELESCLRRVPTATLYENDGPTEMRCKFCDRTIYDCNNNTLKSCWYHEWKDVLKLRGKYEM